MTTRIHSPGTNGKPSPQNSDRYRDRYRKPAEKPGFRKPHPPGRMTGPLLQFGWFSASKGPQAKMKRPNLAGTIKTGKNL